LDELTIKNLVNNYEVKCDIVTIHYMERNIITANQVQVNDESGVDGCVTLNLKENKITLNDIKYDTDFLKESIELLLEKRVVDKQYKYLYRLEILKASDLFDHLSENRTYHQFIGKVQQIYQHIKIKSTSNDNIVLILPLWLKNITQEHLNSVDVYYTKHLQNNIIMLPKQDNDLSEFRLIKNKNKYAIYMSGDFNKKYVVIDVKSITEDRINKLKTILRID